MHEHVGPYLGVLIALWIASCGVPVPEDIALMTGGFLCYKESARFIPMVLVAMFGVLSGDLFIFSIGRRWGPTLLDHKFTRRLAPPDKVNALRAQFLRHQLKTVFVGRFLPGMRTLVFLTAGASQMSVWRFLLANGTAALGSVPAFVALGYVFGHSFDKLKERVADIEHVIVFVAIIAAVLWVLWLFYARSAKARETARLMAIDKEKEQSREKGAPEPQTPAARFPVAPSAPSSLVQRSSTRGVARVDSISL